MYMSMKADNEADESVIISHLVVLNTPMATAGRPEAPAADWQPT